MVKKLGKGMSLTLVFAVAVSSLIFAYSCSSPPARTSEMKASETPNEIDSLSVNAACYVCHMSFVKEQISKTHLDKNVTCIRCHGLSAAHANDENVGATPPDITFQRDRIDVMCLECHKRHDMSAEKLAGFQIPPVCTDCHGSHRISGSAG
ncbi:MAG TPA: cytochrome c3 family protein [Sedimentisphaerales bacterium]|nr:cytochrome c3 family protein [Sedimentisphaerales bacterium]